MNRLRSTLLVVGALLSTTPAILADSAQVAERAGVIRQGVSGTTYSQELPVLARVQGTAFFKTFVSFTNNTNSNGVTASYQFSYTCLARATCSPAGGFYRTPVQTVTLPALGSFVQDDFIDYLNTQSLLQPGANAGTIGTLLVTFANLPSSNGWEANVVARVYNRIVEADPNAGHRRLRLQRVGILRLRRHDPRRLRARHEGGSDHRRQGPHQRRHPQHRHQRHEPEHDGGHHLLRHGHRGEGG